MGALNYSNLILIKGDANAAFNRAVENENDYSGHQEGYSGDIQTAEGFMMAKKYPRYGTKAFKKWEEKAEDDLDKGDCVCVELHPAAVKQLKERRGRKGGKGYKAFYFFGLGRY